MSAPGGTDAPRVVCAEKKKRPLRPKNHRERRARALSHKARFRPPLPASKVSPRARARARPKRVLSRARSVTDLSIGSRSGGTRGDGLPPTTVVFLRSRLGLVPSLRFGRNTCSGKRCSRTATRAFEARVRPRSLTLVSTTLKKTHTSTRTSDAGANRFGHERLVGECEAVPPCFTSSFKYALPIHA